MEAKNGRDSCRQIIVGHYGHWYYMGMAMEDLMKLQRKVKFTIWLCLLDSLLLNLFREVTTCKESWGKCGDLYQSSNP